jgi:phage baseplate assembly protein W
VTPEPEDDILDDLFHGCALAAFIDQAIAEGGPPCMEATRRRAFAYYEQELAERNRRSR